MLSPAESNLSCELLGESLCHGAQAHLGNALTPGPAEVRAEHELRVARERVAKRRQGGADTRVILNDAISERYVEIDADEDTAPCHIEINHAQLLHSLLEQNQDYSAVGLCYTAP